MSSGSDFQVLLNATIDHLEAAKRRGQRFVQVDPQLLRDLAQPLPAAQTSPAPKPNRISLPPELAPAPALAPARAASPSALISAPPKPSPGSPPPVIAFPSAGPITDKVAAMAALRERVMTCITCVHLASSRKNVVFGVGNIHSPLMFVGEAPGADEDVQGEPFVGPAGQLLTKIIQTMGLTREGIYIANVLKCRPDTPGQAWGNRKPTPEEMKTCLPYLQEQIRIIQPRVIVALGATAVEGLFNKSSVAISKLRGQWMQLNGVDVMPTYHPSYVLRNQALATKRETWEDMLAAMERLGMPITEKQRGYFLR